MTIQNTRQSPNILITGTPGTGKTTTATLLAIATELHHINVGELVKTKSLHEGYCEEFDAYYLDEDKVCDELENAMRQGGNIVDHHSCDFFPERWFDLVIVLTADNTILYDRLIGRGYSQKKISENIECEIMRVSVDEALGSYRESIVWILDSNSTEEMEQNVEKISEWVDQFVPETDPIQLNEN